MNSRIKFSVGNVRRGYKSVEISVDGTKVEYKILRNEFKPVDKNPVAVNVDNNRLDALNIFAWEKIYFGEETSDGEQWSLTFTDGNEIYRGRGTNAYPDAWDDFLDALDALIPEMQFVDVRRVDAVEMQLSNVEKLSLSRNGILTIEKISSTHEYRLSTEDTKKFLDVCQKYFDALEIADFNGDGLNISVKLTRHDQSTTDFSASYSEIAMPGVVKFAEDIHAFAADLSAEIFCPEASHVTGDAERFILCKVQFKGNYKAYTYRAEDETLAVGEIVDVPVGRNNDVTQAKIVDIGYFDEDEVTIPLDRIKTIIGRHTGNAWDNY